MPHKTTVRKPDLGLILKTNPTPIADTDRTYAGVFNLGIESVSNYTQSGVNRDILVKKNEYEAIGVQEYYILDERGVHTNFYELTSSGLYQPIQPQADGVIVSRVLPGFQFRIEDLYRKPSRHDLVRDSVYQGFVVPAYQVEKKRAEQEHQRAEQECQQKEKLIAQLKALGIEPQLDG